jgi:hypothetical protein
MEKTFIPKEQVLADLKNNLQKELDALPIVSGKVVDRIEWTLEGIEIWVKEK